MRLMTALTAIKFRSWPGAGPVAIRETHPEHGWEQVHVFNQWHYIGSAKCESEFEDLSSASRAAMFDADIYKLLVRYFVKGGSYMSLPTLT